MASGLLSAQRTDRFKRDYERLDDKQREAVDACIRDLFLEVIPASRRFHCVDKKRPKIYSMDVFTNITTYKLTLNVEGTHAILRRVDTHKAIDRNP